MLLHADVTIHGSTHEAEILEKLDLILERLKDMAHTLEETLALVTAEPTRLDSIIALIEGLEKQLADVLSGASLPAAVQAKVDAMFDAATASAGKIDTAIAAGTPPAPVPPAV